MIVLWPLSATGTPGRAATRTAADLTPLSSAQPALHVIPFPDTPDASPHTQIIFSSLAPSDLAADPVVIGSTSGPHQGHLSLLPDHAGTVFTPTPAFTPGEKVTVNAVLNSPQAGTQSGDPNSTNLSFSFTIEVPVSQTTTAAAERPARDAANGDTQSFRSQPGLHPPAVSVSGRADPGAGDIFLANIKQFQAGPMILDGSGKLVWFHPTGDEVYNLERQHYRGHPVLTWWQGKFLHFGEDVIMNRFYRTVAVLHGQEGYYPDLHELQITGGRTAVYNAVTLVRADLSSTGGPPDGIVRDCIIQQVDVRTGKLLWEWHALGHVPVSASYATNPNNSRPDDYCHLNSIQQLPHHRLLISFKDMWALYLVDQSTGRVIWTLGGKDSSFKMGPGTNFEWQHDAHLYGNNRLTVFDDAADPQEEPQSSAKVLRVDTRDMTVSLARRYTHPRPLLALLAGSVQILPDHNVFVGWGSEPVFSEYTPGGHLIFNASLPLGFYSYRAYRFPWSGRPRTKPALALSRRSGNGLWVYASWNGATQVASWRVLGGAGRHSLTPVGGSRRTGFETRIGLASHPRHIAVQALGNHGQVLGRSVALGTGRA